MVVLKIGEEWERGGGGVDFQARKRCLCVWLVEKYLDGLGSF